MLQYISFFEISYYEYTRGLALEKKILSAMPNYEYTRSGFFFNHDLQYEICSKNMYDNLSNKIGSFEI